MEPIAVYVHVPFCPSKCGYCDFNSYAMTGEIQERTTLATCREILSGPLRGRAAKTVFFGGGTPTFLATEQILSILAAVIQAHPPIEGAEITSEANPGVADADKFNAMRKGGFNRLSIGAQSFRDDDLIRLGRVHQSAHIALAVEMARRAGFENVNLDLMFALPHQTPAAWRTNIDRAGKLGTEHLSLYCLTIEPGTPFQKQAAKGLLPTPTDDEQLAMLETTVEVTAALGFDRYEVSNFARPGCECRHNLCYWRGEEYAGYGPGAVGCADIGEGRVRTTNWKHPARYCAAVESGAAPYYDREPLDAATLATERVMLGLRTCEGIRVDDLPGTESRLAPLEELAWIWRRGERMGATRLGMRYLNDLTLELAFADVEKRDTPAKRNEPGARL